MILIFVNRLRMPLLLGLFGIVGCGDSAAGNAAGPQVVTTTSVLGDLVTAVAGPGAEIEVLIPIGVDPHDYQPSAQQMARVAAADLVVINGLGLEEGLATAIFESVAPGTVVVQVAESLDPLPRTDDGSSDPHVWLDPVRMARATHLVAEALLTVDPGGGYAARADDYAARLLAAHTEIENLLAAVPAERRVLVTNHEALRYFADRYGFRIIGVIIPGGSTLAEPSAADLAALVATIRALGVPAIFAETTHPTDLADAIAAEAGTGVAVIELFTESLGAPGTPADTLPGLLVENARRIAAALGG